MFFDLGLALFMNVGADQVMRKLAGTLAWAARGVTVTMPSEEVLPVDKMLGDGTYLSRLKAPRRLRRQGAADIVVRVNE